MSSVNDVTAKAQQAIFDKLGINQAKQTEELGAKQTLGQQDFLKLMTTQLQNQDPFAPMENGDFIAQMAQFSTVSGIKEVNDTLGSLTGEYEKARVATAASLLGHSVLIPGNIVRPDANGEIHGVLDLPQASSFTTLNFTDPVSGELVHTQTLGALPSGLNGFSWTEIPDELRSKNTKLKLEALVDFGDGSQSLSPSIFAEILSASTGEGAADAITIDLADYGEIDVNEVQKFK
jgi:flagellar basal-body rod modification protein FlgD